MHESTRRGIMELRFGETIMFDPVWVICIQAALPRSGPAGAFHRNTERAA